MISFLEGILAIIVGVITFVVSDNIKYTYLTNKKNYLKAKDKISLILNAHFKEFTNETYHMNTNDYNEILDALKKQSYKLMALCESLYWFHPGIPSQKKLKIIIESLNTIADKNKEKPDSKINVDEIKKIKKYLKLYEWRNI